MKRFALSVMVLLMTASPLHALTMDEAVTLALENNPRIKEEKLLHQSSAYRLKTAKGGYYPDVNLNYAFTRQDNVFSFQTKESSVASIEAEYNLFNGFMDKNDIDAAQSRVDAADYERKAVAADIVLETKSAYINLLRAGKNGEVAREAVALLESQKRDVDLYYDQGVVAKNEVLKVDVELASERLALLTAESGERTAAHSLERIVGVGLEERGEMQPLESPEAVPVEYELLAPEMLARRSELNYLKALKRADELNMDSARGEYYPTVDLSLKYSRFGDSLSPSGRNGLHDDETRAMVEVSWELADGFKKRHNVRAAESEFRAAEERIRDLESELLLQLKKAIEAYQLSGERVSVSEKAIIQAAENYRITESRFKERMATSTDLLDARVFLSRAKNDYNNAFYDLLFAAAVLERVVENFISE